MLRRYEAPLTELWARPITSFDSIRSERLPPTQPQQADSSARPKERWASVGLRSTHVHRSNCTGAIPRWRWYHSANAFGSWLRKNNPPMPRTRSLGLFTLGSSGFDSLTPEVPRVAMVEAPSNSVLRSIVILRPRLFSSANREFHNSARMIRCPSRPRATSLLQFANDR